MSSQDGMDAYFGNNDKSQVPNRPSKKAIQQISTQVPQTVAPQPVQAKQSNVSAPPTAVMKTPEDLTMEKYDLSKQKLYACEKQITEVAFSDNSGDILRNFGLSQITFQVGDEIDRIEGLVLLRVLKTKCKMVEKTKGRGEEGELMQIAEEVLHSVYEVWGIMDDGTVGLTSSYTPETIKFIVGLKSGYDCPPEE